MAGCSGEKAAPVGKILPERIENIQDQDIIPEGAEGMENGEFDAGAFLPRMFVGAWKLQQAPEKMPEIEVPAPAGSGMENLAIEALPVSMVFYNTIRGPEQEIYRIPFDDYYYLQAEYKQASGGAESTETSETGENVLWDGETVAFRMLFDTAQKTLAFGFTGEVTDERYFNENVDTADISEVDYAFDWNGYELKLTYGGVSATYVPSTYEGDMQKACEGFSAGNARRVNTDWKFAPLNMNGDGTGTVGTFYDTDVMMQYAFGEDGSFTVTTEHGEVFTYDKYWYSDSCLTLPSGDVKMMYQHDMLTFYSEDPHLVKSIDNNFGMEELVISGKKLGCPFWTPVKELISKGYRTDVDTENSMIPSGCISPEFKLAFRSSTIHVQAVNPTDIALPLSACIVCRYRFDADDGSISRRVRFMIGDETVKCGETGREELQSYNNLVQVNDHHMSAQVTQFGSLGDYDFSDYSAHVLEGMDGSDHTVFLDMEVQDEILQEIDCGLAFFLNRDLAYNMEAQTLQGLSQADCVATAKYRDTLAADLQAACAALPEVTCDSFGTVYIPWPELFSYGTAELTDEGKQILDKLTEQYTAVLKKYDKAAAVEVGAYARCDLKEEGQSFTVPRADAVSAYLENKTANSSLRMISTGYGESEYLLSEETDELPSNLVAVRCLLDPVTDPKAAGQEIKLVYKAEDSKPAYIYMQQDEKKVGKTRAAFAEKYKGVYGDDLYTNEAVGMSWQLPEGWHFYDDDELTAYNEAAAEDLLLKELPIYAFAAVNEDYDTMIDLRLYPCKGNTYEQAGEEFARSLFESYESVCRTDYTNVTAEAEDVTLGGKTVKKGTFRFCADEQSFVRKQYYLVFEDAAAVITLTGTEDAPVLDDPGLQQ